MSHPSTLPDWAVDHMNRYLETDGEDGHIWRGVPTLLLTTLGRSSGEQRMLPLIYGKDGDDHIMWLPGRPCGPSSVVSQSAGVKRRERASGRGQILCEGGTC